MPWCPDCKTEYRKGYETCKDCGQKLVNELPKGKTKEQPEFISSDEKVDWVLFKNLYPNDREGDIVISILKANDIPVLRKYPHTGDYTNIYMGLANEMQIFVPSNMYNKAEEIIREIQLEPVNDFTSEEDLENLMDADEFIEDEDAQVEGNEFLMPYKSKRGIGIIIIIVIILFPLVFLLINKFLLINGLNIGPITGPRP